MSNDKETAPATAAAPSAEAERLAKFLMARQSHLGARRSACWDDEKTAWDAPVIALAASAAWDSWACLVFTMRCVAATIACRRSGVVAVIPWPQPASR